MRPFKSKVNKGIITIGNAYINKYLNGKDFVIILFSLTLFLIASLQLFNDTNNWILYKYDDVDHLSYSYNLYHGNGLQKGIIDLEASTLEKNIPALSKYDQINTHLIGKNPLYFVLLGGWLYLLNANFENWFFYGSIFNLLLTSICIVTYYSMVKKFFGLGVAVFTTPLLSTMPGLIWFAVRIRPDMLLLLLIVVGIYAALRKINYSSAVITGVIVALAHFTHPLGLILGVAIFMYYFVQKKFRAAGLLILTWFVILIPWLVRNYLIYGDPIRGFGLPIPRGILTFLGVTSSNSSQIEVYPDTFHAISIIETLGGMINELTNLYGMGYFLIFISLSIFAYICFTSLKVTIASKQRNKVLFGVGLVFYGSCILFMLTNHSGSANFIIPILVIFLIPFVTFIYIKIFSPHRMIFTSNGNSAYILLGIYAVINFVIYIMYTQLSGRVTPEVRIIIISLYMLLPLAIVGLKKILYHIFSFMKENHKTTAVIITMVVLLGIYSSYQTYTGLGIIDSRLVSLSGKPYQYVMNAWIRENIPKDANIASDMPHLLTLQTGLNSINFAQAYKDNVSYEEWVIKKFDIDYLVFYYPKWGNQELAHVELNGFKLEKIYSSKEKALVYKVVEK